MTNICSFVVGMAIANLLNCYWNY